jgi:hypothetical protein
MESEEQRAEDTAQRTENREQRTENREQRTENREQRTEGKEQRVESTTESREERTLTVASRRYLEELKSNDEDREREDELVQQGAPVIIFVRCDNNETKYIIPPTIAATYKDNIQRTSSTHLSRLNTWTFGSDATSNRLETE